MNDVNSNRTELSRRKLLSTGALLGAGVIAGAFTAGCSAGQAAPVIPTKRRRGGNLLIGISGGGSTDQLDADKIFSVADNCRLYQLYEWLSIRDHTFGLQKVLATSYSHDPTFTQWTVELRRGVEFHNGKTLTADDVIYSFKRILNPATAAAGLPLISFIDPNGMTKLDDYTVRFTLQRPFVFFEDRVANQLIAIVPVGYDPLKPVGTGPFRYGSFTPGRQSVFPRWQNYWQPGLPYVDEVTIIDLSDDTARVNALVSGAVDAIDSVPYASTPGVTSNSDLSLLVSKTGAFRNITMRVDKPPFNDVRVRQAFKLMADREQIVQIALDGFGRVANDLYTPQDPFYDHSIPQRVQDITQAKFLLKKAGQEGLTTQLVTAPLIGGTVEMAVVFAQQAKAAGVNVQIVQLDPTTFYNNQYLNRTFSVDWWSSNSYFTQVAYEDGPQASYNDTHWDQSAFESMYTKAIASGSSATQEELAHQMQQIYWEQSGSLIWGFADGVDAYNKRIVGLVPDYTGQGLSSFDFKEVSFV
jgi:peptide/nickel transport system substrate-binding protein